MKTAVQFFATGTPAPQGSKNGYYRGGRVVLVESSKKVKPWRAIVAQTAALACRESIDGPVSVQLEFVLPRPKSLPKKVTHMVKKPDLDKLIRSTLDALSGIAYVDDNRVARIVATKRYARDGEQTGATIHVTPDEAPEPVSVDRDPATTILTEQELDEISGDDFDSEPLRRAVREFSANPHAGCGGHAGYRPECEWCPKLYEAAVALRIRYFDRQGSGDQP